MAELFKLQQNATVLSTQSSTAFEGSLATGFALFAAFMAGFIAVKDLLPRLYQPKSYLLPDGERPKAPPRGPLAWLVPVWKTSSLEIIQKCGLDAYFFLRYLAMLVKIFVPLLFTVMPILLCVNGIGGKGQDYWMYPPYNLSNDTVLTWSASKQQGLNLLSWGNVRPDQHNRYWAHLLMAIGVILWCLYVFYDELKDYIGLRQAYLLSPQHRIRASATTVLIQSIPLEWCTKESLKGLFEQYGPIRNIWINRDYSDLLDRVKERDNLSDKLESALTELVKRCWKSDLKRQQKKGKRAGRRQTKAEKKATLEEAKSNAERRATTRTSTEKDVANAETEIVPRSMSPRVDGADDVTEARLSHSSDSQGTKFSPALAEVPESDVKHAEMSTGDDLEAAPAGSTSKVDSRIDKTDGEKGRVSDDTELDYLDEKYDPRNDGEPLWKDYLQDSDRPTMRLPLWNQGWLDWVPWTGEKVDTIDYCRKEVARLTAHIEREQANPDKYHIMNSAFIQFESQTAAHLACRYTAFHVPDQMTPRVLECSPGDVIWENMAMKWWERWVWSVVVTCLIVLLIILYAIPATFIGLLSHLSLLAVNYPWMAWALKIAPPGLAVIQGILPAALTGLLLVLVPLIMRALSRLRGTPTGMLVELDVSTYYFWFSFVELFLVITIAAGLLPLLGSFNDLVTGIPALLTTNIPTASNYYFSYLLLQGLSNSSSNLLQIVQLLLWFLWAPLVDSTAREKWKRQINLPTIPWGSFFPAFSNLACIGLIYSVIAPLMIVFNVISFVLFWFAYRYLTIYVNTFKFDTGGLLFPRAVNQLFVGLYFMEICLIVLFFAVQGVDPDGTTNGGVCAPQGAIMVVVFFLTIIAQKRLQWSFGELYQFLPVTYLAEADSSDETFALLHTTKLSDINDPETGSGPSHEDVSVQKQARELSRKLTKNGKTSKPTKKGETSHSEQYELQQLRVARDAVVRAVKQPLKAADLAFSTVDKTLDRLHMDKIKLDLPPNVGAKLNSHGAVSDALFAGLHTALHELSPELREELTEKAFQHKALRARRRVLWLPNDELGVAADEAARIKRSSQYMDVSLDGAALDGKGKVVFGMSPPDFKEEDLIEL